VVTGFDREELPSDLSCFYKHQVRDNLLQRRDCRAEIYTVITAMGYRNRSH
jgi:hypothetical protein